MRSFCSAVMWRPSWCPASSRYVTSCMLDQGLRPPSGHVVVTQCQHHVDMLRIAQNMMCSFMPGASAHGSKPRHALPKCATAQSCVHLLHRAKHKLKAVLHAQVALLLKMRWDYPSDQDRSTSAPATDRVPVMVWSERAIYTR